MVRRRIFAPLFCSEQIRSRPIMTQPETYFLVPYGVRRSRRNFRGGGCFVTGRGPSPPRDRSGAASRGGAGSGGQGLGIPPQFPEFQTKSDCLENVKMATMDVVKVCRTCGLEKSLSEFYALQSGWTHKDCKSCSKVAGARRNSERYRSDPRAGAIQVVHSQNNRSKKLGDVGILEPRVIAQQLVEAPVCLYCRQPNLFQGQGLCLDHRTPLIRGGRSELENIAIVCESCNRAKWDTTEVEYGDWLKQRVLRLSAES